MKGRPTALLLAVSLALGAASPTLADNHPRSGDGAALVIGAIVGLGVAAAISNGRQHDWENGDTYREPFSPSANVVCLPQPRRCYDHGHFSWRWTQRIFG